MRTLVVTGIVVVLGVSWVGLLLAFPNGGAPAAAPSGARPLDLGTAPLRIEAEARVTGAARCAQDGEVMKTNTDVAGFQGETGVAPSAGATLFYPQSDCWAEWLVPSLVASDAIVLGSFHFNGDSSTPTECVRWDVFVDGAAWGSTPSHCDERESGTFHPYSVASDGSRTLTAGVHVVRVVMRVTEGPGWANGYLDYIEPPLLPGETPLGDLFEKAVALGDLVGVADVKADGTAAVAQVGVFQLAVQRSAARELKVGLESLAPEGKVYAVQMEHGIAGRSDELEIRGDAVAADGSRTPLTVSEASSLEDALRISPGEAVEYWAVDGAATTYLVIANPHHSKKELVIGWRAAGADPTSDGGPGPRGQAPGLAAWMPLAVLAAGGVAASRRR